MSIKAEKKMMLVIDELDGPYYMDVVLSSDEIDRIRLGEMVDGYACVGGRSFYVGARMHGRYEYEKDSWEEENFEGC